MTWTIYNLADGALILNGWPGEEHPRDSGFAWDDALHGAVRGAAGDIAAMRWNPVAVCWEDDLAASRAALRDAVCDCAERVRNQFLTPGSGQAITYTRKEAEARAWQPGDDPASAPFLAAEAAAVSMTIDDLAALVIAQADAWVAAGSAIEARRRGLLVAIEEATTRAALDALDIEAGWSGQ